MSGIVIAAIAGTAVLLCFPPVTELRRTGRRRLPPWALVVPGLAVALVLAGLPPRRLVLLVVVLASLADLARRFRRRRHRQAALRRAGRLLVTCEALAADLQAGLPPLRALQGAAAEWSEFEPVLRAAEWGGDVPDAMRALAVLPGAGQSRVVAAAWQVAHRSGAGLAPSLTLAAQALREDRATAAVVETELAGARATAVLLALLPVGLLALGSGVGGDPVGFLIGTSPGLGCLALGLVLVHLGLAWIDAIADGISR